MVDFRTAKILGHRRNIERYCRLLATELTDLERQYLHKRIAEEHVQLERLEKSQPEQQAEVIAAAETLGKHTGGQSHV
jgi:5-bromo-4-chloroindolyl phosphate hydrolysis protein